MIKFLAVLILTGSLGAFGADESTTSVKAETAPPSARSWNITLSPVGLAYGAYGINAEKDMGGGWTLGGAVARLEGTNSIVEHSATALSLIATLYFSGASFTNSFYLGPTASYFRADTEYLGFRGNTAGFAVGGRAGHQWVWNRFNLQFGAAVANYANLYALGLDLNLGFLL